MFHLISARCEYSAGVRCIDIFTHNSLRNKEDSLTALSGTHRTIKLDYDHYI